MTKVGVLALQGAFEEHAYMLRRVGAEPVEVRKPDHLNGLRGLIMPGGESTTISRLARIGGLLGPLQHFGQEQPIWGTCAGAILLAKHIKGEAAHLALMDISIIRNAFGSQIDSFVTDLDVKGLFQPLRAVFIRAPIIESVGAGVEILSRLPDGRIVAARQGHLLATSFHPELTPDIQMHDYFMGMVRRVKVIA